MKVRLLMIAARFLLELVAIPFGLALASPDWQTREIWHLAAERCPVVAIPLVEHSDPEVRHRARLIAGDRFETAAGRLSAIAAIYGNESPSPSWWAVGDRWRHLQWLSVGLGVEADTFGRWIAPTIWTPFPVDTPCVLNALRSHVRAAKVVTMPGAEPSEPTDPESD